MKNPRTAGSVKFSSVRSGEKSNILSPAKEINLLTRAAYREKEVSEPTENGSIGWVKR